MFGRFGGELFSGSLANLDAARWHTSPLVKQGLASDRYLPGRNAMPVNKSMYFYCEQNLQ